MPENEGVGVKEQEVDQQKQEWGKVLPEVAEVVRVAAWDVE